MAKNVAARFPLDLELQYKRWATKHCLKCPACAGEAGTDGGAGRGGGVRGVLLLPHRGGGGGGWGGWRHHAEVNPLTETTTRPRRNIFE